MKILFVGYLRIANLSSAYILQDFLGLSKGPKEVLCFPLPLRELRPQEIPQMHDGHDGVVQEHARTRIAHHLTYLLTHGRLVAMHRTSGATGFVLAKLAMLQTLVGIIQQGLALRAERGNGER